MGLALAGCGGAGAPAAAPADDGKCSAAPPSGELDLIGVNPALRAKIVGLQKQGVIAVRYEPKGCDADLEVIPDCTALESSIYEMHAQSESQTKVFRSRGELSAGITLGLASLSAKLTAGKELRADYLLVATLSIPARIDISRDGLRGPGCAKATHVVRTIHFGAFSVAAGSEEKLAASGSVFLAGEAGAERSSSVEVLDHGGSPEACKKAQGTFHRPPDCWVPLRLALSPISAAGPVIDGVQFPPTDDNTEVYGFWMQKLQRSDGSSALVLEEIARARKARAQIKPAPKYAGPRSEAVMTERIGKKYAEWLDAKTALLHKADVAYLSAYKNTASPADWMDITAEDAAMWFEYVEEQRALTPEWPEASAAERKTLQARYRGDIYEEATRDARYAAMRCLWVSWKHKLPKPAKCAAIVQHLDE